MTKLKDISYDKTQSIIAMFVAWFLGYLYYAIRMVHFSGWGYVTDFSAVFFWTGLFALISSMTFVPLTIILFNKLNFFKSEIIFPILTNLVSQIALTILLLPFTNIQPFQMGGFFYVYAGIIGFTFGLIYLLFQKKVYFGKGDNISKKIFVLSSPILFLIYFFIYFHI